MSTAPTRSGFSSSTRIWPRFRQRRANRWALRMLYGLLFLALFADFLANEKPLYCQFDEQTYWPIFRDYGVRMGLLAPIGELERTNWLTRDYQAVVRAPIPYSPGTIDRRNMRALGPFAKQRVRSWRFRHWMGTDELGKDVAAGLVHGTRTALLVGLVAMTVAALIGIFFGGLAGYFGDDRLKWPRRRFWFFGVGLLPWLFWGWIAPAPWIFGESLIGRIMWIAGLFIALIGLSLWIVPDREGQIRRSWPIDFGVMRLIEVMNAIPALMLLLAIVATLERSSLLLVMAIIGAIRWTGIARFVRAELLRIRDQHYIEAARVLGLSERQILFRHALPNGLRPVFITIAFGISGAILLEAFLSFLGIGLPADAVTWGTLLNKIKTNTSAWWLALFPGMAIFITVTIFNLIGEGLTEAMGNDPATNA